jgi:hypothetical protein
MVNNRKLKGKAWVFGDILDIDFDICPIETMKGEGRPKTEKDWGKYLMINIDPDFPKKIKPGDFITVTSFIILLMWVFRSSSCLV